MSRVCEICGKGKMDGKTVSHANNKWNQWKESEGLHKMHQNSKEKRINTRFNLFLYIWICFAQKNNLKAKVVFYCFLL